jgi:hypothetical protein
LDIRLGRGLSAEEVERFAREDPKVKAHLEVIRRKELLELVLEKMGAIRDLERAEQGRKGRGKSENDVKRKEGKGWSLF